MLMEVINRNMKVRKEYNGSYWISSYKIIKKRLLKVILVKQKKLHASL